MWVDERLPVFQGFAYERKRNDPDRTLLLPRRPAPVLARS